MRRALALGALLCALGTLGGWLYAIAAVSQPPPPAVRLYGEPRAGESWFRLAAFDEEKRRVVPVEGTLGFDGRLTTLKHEHANVTLGEGALTLDARLALDDHELEMAIPIEAPQTCADNPLRFERWQEAVLSGPSGPPVYPRAGLIRSSAPDQALLLAPEGARVVDVPANAAGPRLDDGRLLRPGRGLIAMRAEPLGEGAFRVKLDAPAFLEVRRDGCLREMRFGDEIEVRDHGERWRSVHAFGSRFDPEGTALFLPPGRPAAEVARELLDGPAAGDPLLEAIAAGQAPDGALAFALARLSWTRQRAGRIGESDAAQRAAWAAARAEDAAAGRWALRGFGLLGALLLAVFTLAGARRPGAGQGRSIALGAFLLLIGLAALGALEWSIALSAK